MSTQTKTANAPNIGNRAVANGQYAVFPDSQGDSTAKQRYMKIRCPSDACKHEMVLVCPYCQQGALKCNGDSYLLVCDQCTNSLRSIGCDCGFTIRSSYIKRKEERLMELQKYADPMAYKVIFGLFLSVGFVGFIIALIAG